MLHFSCDFCGKHLDDRRFVAKLSMFPVFDPEQITEEDLDVDNLEAVAKEIKQAKDDDANASLNPSENSAKEFRFDLCMACYQKVQKDPLGQERLHRFDFSEN